MVQTRKEFQRMLTDARARLFDTIVCWKSDRLGSRQTLSASP